MRLLLILALLLASPTIRAKDQPNQFVLLSICIAKGVYRFCLLSSADFAAFVNHTSGHRREFPPGDPNAGYLPNASALKRTIADRVPQGSTIEWSGWRLADTCYPPKPVIDDIRVFAASHHIDIRIQEDELVE
jgi:hypothetical protein